MKGSIHNIGTNHWAVMFDLLADPKVLDPKTGKPKRRQKRVVVRGTEQDAAKKLNELVGSVHRNEFVEPSKLTVGEWLTEWLDKVIRLKSKNTYKTFHHRATMRIIPRIGDKRLQALRASDLLAFFEELTADGLAPASVKQIHGLIRSALNVAVEDELLTKNVAAGLRKRLPKVQHTADEVAANCWTLDQAKAFISVAKQECPRDAAFFALALDSGARRGELFGLKWADIDLDKGRISIKRQLLDPGTRKKRSLRGTTTKPEWGPTKTRRPRTVDIGAETVRLLREHKRTQAELKMRNRSRLQRPRRGVRA
jgi:integrase